MSAPSPKPTALPPPRQSFSEATQLMLEDYRARIEAASVYHIAEKTPLMKAEKLSKRFGQHWYLKREDLQPVFSFKLRGAYNRMSKLSASERRRGVVTASAGNHAQGVALAGRELGIRTLIVMPRTTPNIKVEAVRSLGGEVLLVGDAFDDAADHARQLVQQGYTYIPPYDDPEVIAGQGTVGKEILAQCVPDAIFVCTGGGGLLAGIAAYVKSKHPQTRIYSVEPADSDCFAQAFEAGHPVSLPQVGLFADGVAVKRVGETCFNVAYPLVDGVIRVEIDEICAAIRDVFYECRALPEPAGALAVAGMKRFIKENPQPDHSQHWVATVSGANVNFDRLRHIAERTELGDEAEALFAVTLPEQPGSFKQFLAELGSRTVTEFNYRYSGSSEAHIFVGVKLLKGKAESAALLAQIAEHYPVQDLSQNEMAKLHIRFMVGGRALVSNERLLRFEFPERPGACLAFLETIGSRWNISLFHYRNHGAAEGRVLVGLQVADAEWPQCLAQLESLHYEFWDESQNPAYQLFLGP
jgi:threonine dehydratase